jgi:hypothetical protein
MSVRRSMGRAPDQTLANEDGTETYLYNLEAGLVAAFIIQKGQVRIIVLTRVE